MTDNFEIKGNSGNTVRSGEMSRMEIKDRYLQAISAVSQMLLEDIEFNRKINSCLAYLGKVVETDRVYIFQFYLNEEDNTTWMKQIFEWTSRPELAQIDNPGLLAWPVEQVTPLTYQTFKDNGHYKAKHSEFIDELFESLDSQGIKSILFLPLFVDQKLWGFMGFDDCFDEREWVDDDIILLKGAATNLVMYISKELVEHDKVESTRILQEAVDNSEEKVRAIIAAIPDMLFVLTKEGNYEEYYSASGDSADLLIPREFFIGKNVKEVLPSGLAGQFITGFNKVLGGMDLEIIEYQLDVPSGRKYFEARVAPIKTQNKVLCIIRDITTRIQQEQELANALIREKELSELKSNFISNTSHEFRTPMSIIQSSADILENYTQMMKPDQVDYHFKRIRTSIKFLTEMLDDILFIEKSNAHKMTLDPVSEDLCSFCENVKKDVLANEPAGTVITIESELYTKIQRIDVKLLYSVLSNLLTNAVKYSPAGSEVKIGLSESEGFLTLTVEDQGIGIAEEDQENLFEPFFRGKNVDEIPGTGLGLPIVKRSVDLMGGTISVESRSGSGSKFKIDIPKYLSKKFIQV